MTTRYDSFAVFMADVVRETKSRMVSNPYQTAWSAVTQIMEKTGWLGFLAVCALLGLGYLAFAVAIIPFLATPVGIIIVTLGGGALLWTLWRNKKLPLAVKKIGERYKSRYEAQNGDRSQIDVLLHEAASELYHELLFG